METSHSSEFNPQASEEVNHIEAFKTYFGSNQKKFQEEEIGFIENLFTRNLDQSLFLSELEEYAKKLDTKSFVRNYYALCATAAGEQPVEMKMKNKGFPFEVYYIAAVFLAPVLSGFYFMPFTLLILAAVGVWRLLKNIKAKNWPLVVLYIVILVPICFVLYVLFTFLSFFSLFSGISV